MEIRVFGSSSKGNCYLIQDGDSHLLIEAGVNPKYLQVDWSKVDAILLTHEHGDHAKYINQVIKRCASSVYCTKGTAQAIDVPKYRTMTVKATEPFTVKNWNILPFDVEHDVNEPVGYLIDSPSGKRILFATDTYYIRYRFNNVTHMMVECNYSLEILNQNYDAGRIDKGRRNRLLTSHFELGNVIEFIKANDISKLEEVYLLHLSDSNSNAVQFKQAVEQVTGIPVTIA